MKVFEVRLFAAALLGAALFFFVAGCTDGEPTPEPACATLAECFADNNGIDNNGETTICGGLNVDVNNGDTNDGCNNDINEPECTVDADCADTEICADISECLDRCENTNCGDFACEATTGECFDPCAEYNWVNEYRWHCPGFRSDDIEVFLGAIDGECVTESDLWNETLLPSEWMRFDKSNKKITVIDSLDPDFSAMCVPM